MTASTFLMHAFYIGAPLVIGFFVGIKYASKTAVKEKPLEGDREG